MFEYSTQRILESNMAKRTPLSIQYQTDLESINVLLKSFDELAERIVVTTTQTVAEYSEYLLFSSKFAI